MDVDHLPPFLRVPQAQELLQLSRTQVWVCQMVCVNGGGLMTCGGAL